ncbi:MAG: beta-ketoacyl synthase N-terminal-like domain-containing protein [Bacteroidales bacterium]
MKTPFLRKKVYLAAGYNTISMGTGRKEFNPRKERPALEDYIREAGQGTLAQIADAGLIDECVISNFMASGYNRQSNLAAFFPMIDLKLKHKPAIRVEGACGSGGLAIVTGIKSILSENADVVLVLGVEVQNSVKAVYGADILATAGWSKNRKNGHAHFFPGQFSDRAGTYYQKYGKEHTRKSYAQWYANMIENARLCPTAQEFHNTLENPFQTHLTAEPNGKFFVDHLNLYDCSKVSDGASAALICSEKGIEKLGIAKQNAVEVVSFATLADDLTQKPEIPTELSNFKLAANKALTAAGITMNEIATAEIHDCFTAAAVLAVEALGLASEGKGGHFILDGHTSRNGKIPLNTTGGLIGWGHPVGATGVHMAVTLWEQMTGRALKSQIRIEKPYGLMVNMGGDDRTLASIVFRKSV